MELTLNLVREAIGGNPTALDRILAKYDSFISAHSYVEEIDEHGNLTKRLDPDVKADLRQALALAISKFNIGRKYKK